MLFQEFRKSIEEFTTVGVYSHIRPDADCIGAQVAASLWLEKNGIRAIAFNDYTVPQNLAWLCDYFPIEQPDSESTAQCDAFILLDGNSPDRFGSYESIQKQFPRPSFMIDHHPEPKDAFDLSISVVDAASTCELIYKLYQEHDIDQLDGQAARAIYAGIISDTGSFQYDSVTPETLEIAADLLRRGDFRPNEIVEKIFSNKTPRQLKLLSKALHTIELYENNQIATMYVNSSMLEETNTSNEDMEGFVNYPLSIAEVKAAILLKDLDDKGVKLSLRSRSEIDVNEWAKELDGGGHKKAAGAWHPGPLESAIREVIKIGVKQLKRIEKNDLLTK